MYPSQGRERRIKWVKCHCKYGDLMFDTALVNAAVLKSGFVRAGAPLCRVFFSFLFCFVFVHFFFFFNLPRPHSKRPPEPEREQSPKALGRALKRTFPEKNGVQQL